VSVPAVGDVTRVVPTDSHAPGTVARSVLLTVALTEGRASSGVYATSSASLGGPASTRRPPTACVESVEGTVASPPPDMTSAFAAAATSAAVARSS